MRAIKDMIQVDLPDGTRGSIARPIRQKRIVDGRWIGEVTLWGDRYYVQQLAHHNQWRIVSALDCYQKIVFPQAVAEIAKARARRKSSVQEVASA